jgi:hypothetical protein
MCIHTELLNRAKTCIKQKVCILRLQIYQRAELLLKCCLRLKIIEPHKIFFHQLFHIRPSFCILVPSRYTLLFSTAQILREWSVAQQICYFFLSCSSSVLNGVLLFILPVLLFGFCCSVPVFSCSSFRIPLSFLYSCLRAVNFVICEGCRWPSLQP